MRAKEQALEKCLEIYRRSIAPKDPGEAAAESDVELMDKFDIGQDDADNMACVVGAELSPPASAVSGARKKKKEKRGAVVRHQAGLCNAHCSPPKKKSKTQAQNSRKQLNLRDARSQAFLYIYLYTQGGSGKSSRKFCNKSQEFAYSQFFTELKLGFF